VARGPDVVHHRHKVCIGVYIKIFDTVISDLHCWLTRFRVQFPMLLQCLSHADWRLYLENAFGQVLLQKRGLAFIRGISVR